MKKKTKKQELLLDSPFVISFLIVGKKDKDLL